MGIAAAAAISTVGLAASSGSASATGTSYSTTYSKWSGADWTLNDGKNTKLMISGGVDAYGPLFANQTIKNTVSVKISQSFCETGASGDVLVTRELGSEGPVSTGVKADPLQGSASVKATVAVSGTETRTPAGTGGDCNELAPTGATTPISDSVTTNVTWKNAPGSSPVVWANEWEGGIYYNRDAAAKGTVSSTLLGSKTLSNSPTGFLYTGLWAYPTGT